MEYSENIDRQIAELLASRNRLTPAHLPGIPDDEGAALLQHYATLHGAEQHVTWDGSRLLRERPPAEQPSPAQEPAPAAAPGPRPAAGGDSGTKKPSPVDQVLAAPVEKSLLDSAPSGGVSVWIWLLPLLFALPGGLIAWLLVRDTNRSVARTLLIVGVVMTVFYALALFSLQGAFQRAGLMIEQSR